MSIHQFFFSNFVVSANSDIPVSSYKVISHLVTPCLCFQTLNNLWKSKIYHLSSEGSFHKQVLESQHYQPHNLAIVNVPNIPKLDHYNAVFYLTIKNGKELKTAVNNYKHKNV